MSEYQNEYFRIVSFLNMLGFKQNKNNLNVFQKPYSINVESEVIDQDELEKYDLTGSIIISLYGDLIKYSYKNYAALESGRLVIVNNTLNSKFTFDDLLKGLIDIFDRIYGSPEYEFYKAPYYNPGTIMTVTAFKLFGEDKVQDYISGDSEKFV